MSNAKISAFAKRRRLNDGSAVEASGSDSSRSGTVNTKAVTPKKPRKREAVQVKLHAAEFTTDDSEALFEGNSFEPLVEAQVVKFSGIREIEDVGRNSCKIRLSRGQECSFVGVVKLWVRDGSVEVYGATLTESPNVYTIFAPYVDNAVSVKSISKTAEYQLESVEASDPGAPNCLYVPGRIKPRQNELSFQIIDFEEHSGVLPKPVADRDDRFKSLLKSLTLVKNKCVLICGKKSSSTAHTSLTLINAMLSNPKGYHAEKGIAFLDLDQSIPTRITPGTISLFHQKELMFGPGHVFPLAESTKGSTVISSIYIGCTNDDGGVEVLKIIESMLNAHPGIRKMPLVVRTGKWLATASANTHANLRKILSPSLVLCVDRTKSSSFYEAAVGLAEKGPVLEHIPEFTMHTVSSLAEHRHNLRSHFLFNEYVDRVPTWYRSVADLPKSRHLELSINSSVSELQFLLISGGMIRFDDLSETLTASLVTVVARESGDSDQESAFRILPFQQNLNLRYIGIAYVDGLNESSGIIKLITNVTQTLLEPHYSAGRSIGLVLEKPGPEGQFSRHMLRD